MFNPAESSVGLVLFPDPKELDDKHCWHITLLERPIGRVPVGDDLIFRLSSTSDVEARDANQTAGAFLELGAHGFCNSTSGRAAASASFRARIACKTARAASSAAAAASSKTATAYSSASSARASSR